MMVNTFTNVNGRVRMARRGAVIEVAVEECCPSVLGAPLDADDAAGLALGFTALADPVRLRVLSMLAAAPKGEVCVCDFVEPLGKSQPTISHHLKILGEAGLVHGDRRGKWVWYSLDRERLAGLRAAIDA
jgi:ArsR family transcriptional regulator, arsenate/arsenite/antimonite-responsive transcriptional repressor